MRTPKKATRRKGALTEVLACGTTIQRWVSLVRAHQESLLGLTKRAEVLQSLLDVWDELVALPDDLREE